MMTKAFANNVHQVECLMYHDGPVAARPTANSYLHVKEPITSQEQTPPVSSGDAENTS